MMIMMSVGGAESVFCEHIARFFNNLMQTRHKHNQKKYINYNIISTPQYITHVIKNILLL